MHACYFADSLYMQEGFYSSTECRSWYCINLINSGADVDTRVLLQPRRTTHISVWTSCDTAMSWDTDSIKLQSSRPVKATNFVVYCGEKVSRRSVAQEPNHYYPLWKSQPSSQEGKIPLAVKEKLGFLSPRKLGLGPKKSRSLGYGKLGSLSPKKLWSLGPRKLGSLGHWNLKSLGHCRLGSLGSKKLGVPP